MINMPLSKAVLKRMMGQTLAMRTDTVTDKTYISYDHLTFQIVGRRFVVKVWQDDLELTEFTAEYSPATDNVLHLNGLSGEIEIVVD